MGIDLLEVIPSRKARINLSAARRTQNKTREEQKGTHDPKVGASPGAVANVIQDPHRTRSYLARMASTIRCIIIAVSLVLLNSSAHGQTPVVNVPKTARDHFAQHYPKAAKQKWKQGSKQIKAEFELKGETFHTIYSAKGEWVRTEHNVKKSEVPAPVMRALLATKYAKWEIAEVEEHATPEHPSLFKVKVKTEVSKAELVFTADGKLLREEEKAR